MPTLETNNENLNSYNVELLKTSAELNDLRIETHTHNLKSEVKKQQQAGKIEYKRDNAEYKIYSYTVEKWGTPAAVRKKAVREGVVNEQNKNKVLVTDINGKLYEESHNFSAGDKIYLKIPKNIQSAPNNPKKKPNTQEINFQQSEQGKFEHKRDNTEYKIYSYTLEKGGTPAAVRKKAVREGVVNEQNKNKVLVTDINGKLYEESHNFSAGDKIYLKIPKNIQSAPNNPEKKQDSQKIDTQEPELGKLEYKNTSRDGKYKIYSYTVDSSTKNQWTISNKAKKELNLKNTRGLEIADSKGLKYGPWKIFNIGEKIYLRIPIVIENDIQIIDSMKCKGGEYFGIDISHFNENIDLKKFKTWNRTKWDSEKKDTRGVSFVYIRASDGKTEDDKVGNHVNKIKEYNNDKTIKDNHEKIAVGFYHRMNSYTAKVQSESFLKTYKKYKDTAGGNNLVPMLDIEGPRINNSKKKDVRNKALAWLKIVEKNTGIVPGIYVTRYLYREYFGNDNRFNKYLTRIAAYPDSDPNTKREIGTAQSIDFKNGTVDVGQSRKQIIKPTMYQSSQEGTVDGAYTIQVENPGTKKQKTYHDTDMDHTKDIRKLFSKNNKSK